MKRCYLVIIPLVFLCSFTWAETENNGSDFLYNFLAGSYELIGRFPDSNMTYTGKVILMKSGDYFKVIRTIKNKVIEGTGKIETAAADKIKVLRSMIFVAVFVIITIEHSSIHGIEVSTARRLKSSLEDSNKVVVHFDARYMETTYRIASGACQISWTVHKSDLNRGVVQHRSKCTLPLSKQLPLLSQILAEILKDTENARSFHTFFWGRLIPDERNGNVEMSFRLAMAAYRSSLWDAKRGKPKTGHANAFVVNLANQSNIYGELKRVFENFDRKLECASVEKVLILEAGKLPFFDRLKKHGVKITDKLPFDCLTWFSVSTIMRQ